MSQAIQTRYLGPTNKLGSRIKAFCSGGTKTYPFKYEYTLQDNHSDAAYSLAVKLGWHVKLAQGVLPNEDYAHVIVKKLACSYKPSPPAHDYSV